MGHVGVLHSTPTVHCRSHAQASRQLTVSHASEPEHVIVQRDPSSQLMFWQAFVPTQLIVQCQPAGQVTLPQPSSLAHSTGQVFATSSQVVAQALGHCGTTQ